MSDETTAVVKDVKIGYSRKQSVNYQSKGVEFGFTLSEADGTKVARAQKFCRAVVDAQLGLKTGLRRSEANALSQEFLGTDWGKAAGSVVEDEYV